MDTASDFQVQRYLGLWHQVAAIPAWFQSECIAHTTARYALREDGLVEVINACETADGSRKQADARARFLATRSVGKLEVTFVKVLGFWLWPAAGDYWIIGLDPEYQWSVVGHPSRRFAWILARSESLDRQTLLEIRRILERAAYDTCELWLTTPEQQARLCDVTSEMVPPSVSRTRQRDGEMIETRTPRGKV
jgi:apolipoprotein D and lipocalin family protein